MIDWAPKSHEDVLIQQYWKKNGGLFFLEVNIGSPRGNFSWPKGSGTRRIDAIRVESKRNEIYPPKQYSYNDFFDIVENKVVELIEAKQELGRYVIGQIIAGHDMFDCEYNAKEIKDVILCFKGDPALEWVCKNRNINVEIFERK